MDGHGVERGDEGAVAGVAEGRGEGRQHHGEAGGDGGQPEALDRDGPLLHQVAEAVDGGLAHVVPRVAEEDHHGGGGGGERCPCSAPPLYFFTVAFDFAK